MRIKLDPGAYIPVRAHETDAGLDLRTPIDFTIPGMDETGTGRAFIDTGVHIEIPPGYYGRIEAKSGLNSLHGVGPFGGGTIDAGYQGSICVQLYNFLSLPYSFKEGQKIAQLVIVPCITPALEVVEDFGTETARGERGFGSTGK